MEALDNKCPACSAKIDFNPKNQKWDCKYCGSKFTLEEMQKYQNASSKEENKKAETKKSTKKEETEDLDIYHCKNCGAEVMADENTTATFCVYCGSTAILKEKIMEGTMPTQIIPFKNVKQDAIEKFKGLSKNRPLMPKFFNETKNIEKISGVYIPFWTYNLNVSGNIDFTYDHVTTWSDYNYCYTKTDTYLAKRNSNMNFERVLVDGSSRFDDDLMDSLEPFHYKGLVEYNHAYLSGFLAEKYDVDEKKAIVRANKRAMNTAIETTRKTVTGAGPTVSKNKLNIKKIKNDYILLPVWMVNVKYKDKTYTFAMNGQTGKMVGNIPLSMKRTVAFSILIFSIVEVITCIVLYMI